MIVFIDIEASGFGGYPIEIGWAVVKGKEPILKDSRLIYHKDWLENGLWDPVAEAVHKISKDELLKNGISVTETATLLNKIFPDFVLSDAPDYDGPWIKQVFEASGVEMAFEVEDKDILVSHIDPQAYLFAEQKLSDIAPYTHRAGDDAYRLAAFYQLARYGELL